MQSAVVSLKHWLFECECKVKGELGELEFYFRKISLHQQKFLVVSILFNSSWLPRNLKNGLK